MWNLTSDVLISGGTKGLASTVPSEHRYPAKDVKAWGPGDQTEASTTAMLHFYSLKELS